MKPLIFAEERRKPQNFAETGMSNLGRDRVSGVGRGGGQAVFSQILTRFHGVRAKSS